ncbi:MAG: hypothetical protein KDK99_15610 [Verrucomicrobiales bacterium]|nr:hypothetical protein [Verrucomicrobiales bacterium]
MTPLLLPAWIRRLIGWLIQRLFRQNSKGSGPLTCPQCGQVLRHLPPIQPEALWDTRVDCPSCSSSFSLLSMSAVENKPERRPIATRPTHTTITEIKDQGSRLWKIPAKRGCNFLLVFATLWTLFSSLFLGVALMGKMEAASSPWMIWLFPGFFIAIGIGLLYAGLRMSWTEHWLLVTDTHLVHQLQFLGRGKRKSFARAGVRSVELVVFYGQNYKPVYGIEIRAAEGKIRFGSSLTMDEKAWLCGEIRTELGLTDPQPSEKDAANAERPSQTAPPTAVDWQVQDGHGQIEIQTAGFKAAKIVLVIALFMVVMIGFMMFAGSDFGIDDNPVFRTIGFVSFLFWYGGLSILLSIVLIIAWLAVRLLRCQQRLRVTADGVVFQLRQGQQTVLERKWRRDEVAAVAVRPVMASRSNRGPWKQDYRLEVVVPDRIVGIGWGIAFTELEAAACRIRERLDLPQPPPESR